MLSRLPSIAIIFAVLLVFAGCAWFDFIPYDDKANIYQNPDLIDFSLANLRRIWTSAHDHLYMPITFSVWAVLAAISRIFVGSMHPSFFHAANVLVHMFNVWLVYQIICQLAQSHNSKERLNAVIAALVFGLHPLVVEPVAWAMGMKDLIAATFALLTIIYYLRSLSNPRSNAYLVSSLLFFAAILCKAATATLPILLFILETYWYRQSSKRSLARLTPWLVIGLFALVATKILQPDAELPFYTAWGDRPLIAADAVAFYLQKFIWPDAMSMDFGHRTDRVISQGWQLTTLATLSLAFFALCWSIWRRNRIVLVIAFMFIVPLLPVLGFVPFGFQAFSTVGARYAYLSLLGLALLVYYLLAQLPRSTAIPLAVFILVTLGTLSRRECLYWQNYATLFARAVDLDPDNWTMRYRYGWALSQDLRLEDAIVQYQAAIAKNDRVAPIHRDLGRALAGLKRWTEAEQSLRTAVGLSPDLPETSESLAGVLHEKALVIVRGGNGNDRERIEAALPIFAEALALSPKDPAIETNFKHAQQLLAP